MYVIYTLKNGKKIQVFLHPDVIESELSNSLPMRDNVIIYEVEDDKVINEKIVDIYKEDNHLFFNYKNERIRIIDFDNYTVDELVEKLENNSSNINDSTIYATLIKDTENVAIYDRRQIPDSVVVGLFRNYFRNNSKYEEVLCLPTQKHRKKVDWSYKLELTPISNKDKIIYGTKDMYFSSFCSLVRSGLIRIVNKNSVIQKVKTMKK